MESKTTILIVDDEAAGREAMEGALYAEGYSLMFASGGKDAFEMAVEYLPDLILLDVMMPGTNGFEVCRMIRAHDILAEMPILMVTALDDRNSRILGLEAGADDFITKPFDRVELRARVRTITRLNRYRSLILERVRFAWVVEQTREGYAVLDEDGEILYANPAAQTFLNLPEDTTGQDFLTQAQKHYRLEPEMNWAQWPAVHELLLFLIRPETNQSQPLILSVEVLELPSGSNNRHLVRINDVSNNLAHQREMWTFQSSVSHKLRTPVSHLVMAAELLQRRAKRLGLEEVDELATALLTGSRRLQGEIQDILQFTAISNLSNHTHQLPVPKIQPFLQELCSEMGTKSVTFQTAPALEQRSLNISWQAFELIFRELVENAIKFHPQLAPNLYVEMTPSGSNMLCIAIADDGVSLSPEQLASVWKPYYQAEKSFSGEVNGMGLGLTAVANLVWKDGGKVRMYNREDQIGVVVEIQLPLN